MHSDAEGVLAIWNDIDEIAEADFLDWHVREHMPERVALPGFLLGQRYVALDGQPKYFNYYEARDPAAFSSAAYRGRLNDPTPWTRRVVSHFRNTIRTVCRRVASAGRGDGAFLQTLRISATDEARFSRAVVNGLLPALVKRPGLVTATLLQGIREASAGDSAEKKLRDRPDEIADWILIAEAVAPDVLFTADHGAFLRDAGARPGWQAGVYQLQFALSAS